MNGIEFVQAGLGVLLGGLGVAFALMAIGIAISLAQNGLPDNDKKDKEQKQ